MRRAFLAIAISGLLVSGAWAGTINTTKSNTFREVNAPVLSATTSLSGASDTQAVYTTPDRGDFILTQLCTAFANGGIRLAVTGFGDIAHTGSVACYSFTPGVSIPKDSTITCSTTAVADPGSYFCMISGFQTTK